MRVRHKNMGAIEVSYLSPEYIEDCFKLLKNNKMAYYYRQLIIFPDESPDKLMRREIRLLQNQFRFDIEKQIESLFQVNSIYEIEEEFGPLVEQFIKEIYIPSSTLIDKCLRKGREILEIRIELNEYKIKKESEMRKKFVDKLDNRLNKSIYRKISIINSSYDTEGLRLVMFFDYE
ncbi:hypothetical protein [Turicibacter sp. HGF1]|uniref:hypothetical protein n=1 Tax=Turicibacter sp. HGF1 TaxID=910310 RepID=UPI0003158B88|nr:hypothetical protein [Turicibacter sp. HGF1]